MKQILITLICTLTFLPFIVKAKNGNPMAELWNNPQFQKEFTASYGTLAGYEPTLSEEDKSRLRTLIKTIKARPKQAIKQLSERPQSMIWDIGSKRDAANLSKIAARQLIKEDGPRVAVFDINGFDTHSGQGSEDGELAEH